MSETALIPLPVWTASSVVTALLLMFYVLPYLVVLAWDLTVTLRYARAAREGSVRTRYLRYNRGRPC